MRKSINNVPLIIEPHPENYSGFKFITLIRYNDQDTINIVDNIVDGQILTYVLDLCGPLGINEIPIIETANSWYSSGSYKKYPLSIEFSKLYLSNEVNKILRVFPIDFVTRLIGPIHEYKMSGHSKCRKRRKR